MNKTIYLNIFIGLAAIWYFTACGAHDSMDGNMVQMGSNTQEMLVLEKQHHDEVRQMQDPTAIIAATDDYAATMTAKVDEMMGMNTNMMSSHAMMDQQDAMWIATNCSAMKAMIDEHLVTVQSMSQADAMINACTSHYQAMREILDNMQSIMQSYGTMPMM